MGTNFQSTKQKLAIKILSLTCNSSRCEVKWSVFEQVIFIVHDNSFHYYLSMQYLLFIHWWV